MQEKVISKNKNGMAVLLLGVLLYIGAFVGMIASIVKVATAVEAGEDVEFLWIAGIIVCGIYVLFGWVIFLDGTSEHVPRQPYLSSRCV